MKYIFIYGWVFISFLSCVEEINFVTDEEDFESALVVEATLTDEAIKQQIILSRTYKFEADGPSPETGAQVSVIADGETIQFTETQPGIYTSNTIFIAEPNVNYQLKIMTSSGKKYESDTTQLTQDTQIDNLYYQRITNDLGEDGVAIYVDSFDPTSQSKFYRYTYEETYKIVAPFYKNSNLIVTGNVFPDCNVALVGRDENVKTCYKTDFSSEIILTTTTDLQEDRVSGFLVRFLNKNNFIISHRYSILVKQYVQQPDAYLFYAKLKEIAEQGSNLFSQIQPGFLNGNLHAENNNQEKVIGFFEVSSVSNARLFFNFSDVFPNQELPPYVINCIPFSPQIIVPGLGGTGSCGELITSLENNTITYWEENASPEEGEGPYWVVPRVCGDCTVLGETQVPDFWID